ncbi:hypothetical protein [Haloarcula sediminis]|uniref:hypothetical protein n=1 Tax=Haloarcula sediminis TaxID=3111777 RepID=UPI002D781DE1|nr:hypothetical protein [Haloarcula sp. CK38]
MSVVNYVTALWTRCVAAVQSVSGEESGATRQSPAGGTLPTHGPGGDDAGDPTLLVYGQALWMAVTLALLFALSLLSLRLYFMVSFIGLLCNRLLFAPRTVTARWWRVVNAITWAGFAVLSYFVYLRIRAGVSTPA